MTTQEDHEIADEILNQLGGNLFIAMTGAKDFSVGDRTLTFRLPLSLARDGINSVSVRLDATDTYTVRFQSIQRTDVKEIAVVTDAYNEDFQRLFTEYTGLDTHL